MKELWRVRWFFVKQWWRLRNAFLALGWWIDENLPSQCPHCGKWSKRGDFETAKMLSGPVVEICPKCYREYFS